MIMIENYFYVHHHFVLGEATVYSSNFVSQVYWSKAKQHFEEIAKDGHGVFAGEVRYVGVFAVGSVVLFDLNVQHLPRLNRDATA